MNIREAMKIVDGRRIYRMGMCDAMAIALHRLTGKPLGVFRGYFPDEDGDDGDMAYESCHAVIVLDWDHPVWIDVDGPRAGLPKNCVLSHQDAKLVLDPISEEEMKHEFSMTGVTEEQIDAAMDFIENDSRLKMLVGHL